MILTLSHWVFQLRAQKLWNEYKSSLLCPVRIPGPWICEHNKWLFQLLSLGTICYIVMVTGTQCNQGFVDEVDSSHIRLHQAERMGAQLSALAHLNPKAGESVIYICPVACDWNLVSTFVLTEWTGSLTQT